MVSIAGLLLVLACIAIETGEHLLYRAGSRAGARGLLQIAAGVALHGLGLVAWFGVLRLLPLGVALPLTGASYAVVALAARFVFHEATRPRRWAGIGLIMVGFALIASRAS